MPEPVPMATIARSLGLGDHEMVALVGGGGKTTIMHALGRQLSGRRVLTTTTKMGSDQTGDLVTVVGEDDDELYRQVAKHGVVLAWASTDRHKAVGITPETADRWFAHVDHVIIEADGARKRPFKAPADFEPVVPTKTTMLVSVIGSDALGHPIEAVCHRPEVVASKCSCGLSDDLTPSRAAQILLHPDGALRTKPPAARFVIAITKVTPDRRRDADTLAELIEQAGHQVFVIADTSAASA